jgi:hypothetical protein
MNVWSHRAVLRSRAVEQEVLDTLDEPTSG